MFQKPPRQQFPEKIAAIHALHHPGQSLGRLLGRGIMVAGPDQIEAVNPARFFRGIGLVQEEAGIMPVGGSAGETFADHFAPAYAGIFPAHFRDPAAVEGGHGVASRQVKAEAHELVQPEGSISGIFQHTPAGNGSREGGIEQVQLCPRLSQGDFQCFRCPVGLREGHGRGSFQNFKALKPEIRGLAGKLQRAFPVIAPAAAAPFQSERIQRTGGILFLQQNAAAPAQSGTAGKGLRISGLNRNTEMQMLRDAVGIDPEEIGIYIRADMEDAVFMGNHRFSPVSFFLYFTEGKSACQ